MSEIKKAIILVAGYEPKLSPLTDKMHQCMFKIGSQTVLEQLLFNISNAGIKEAVLIVGHKAELIKEKIGDSFSNLKIKYVENKDYLTTHVNYSLYLASEEMNESFILIDGDMIVEPLFISDFLKDENENVMAVDFSDQHKPNIVVAKIIGDKITAIGKQIERLDDENFARHIGISKFSKDFAQKLSEKIKSLIENNQKNTIYQDAINEILDKNTVKIFNSRKYNWFEIDTIVEFEKAKKIFSDTKDLKQKAFEFGADDAYILLPQELIFDDRAIMQCFNCKNFGKKQTCPPHKMNVDFESLIKKYKKGLFVLVKLDSSQDFAKARIESTNKLHKILLQLEKVAFSQDNHFTTSFIGGSCKLCPNGCASDGCRNPAMSRIPLESTGVDVVETLKKFGLELKFPAVESIYRVGLLLIG